MKLKHRIIHHFHEVLKAKNSDHEVALGFTIGTFLEIFFIVPGIGLILAILIALIYTKLSKYALFFAVLFWNILFIAPIYLLSYKVSNLLFQTQPAPEFNAAFFTHLYQSSKDFLISHFIISFIISFFTYFIARWIVRIYRKRKDFGFAP